MNLQLFNTSMFWITVSGFDWRKRNKLNTFKAIFSIIFLIFQSIFALMLLFNWEGIATLESLSECIPTLLQTVLKAYAMLHYQRTLLKLTITLKKFWNWNIFGNELKTYVTNMHNFSKKLYVIYNGMNINTLLLFILKPVLMQTKMLPSLRYNWCDISNDTCFYFLYVLQAIEFLYVFVINTGFDAIFFTLITYIYCELEIVKYGFQNYAIQRNVGFSELINHHNLLLNFIKEINDIFSLILLCQFGSTVITICIEVLSINLAGFPPDLGRVANGGAFVICYLIELGIYCIAGSLIIEQADSVAIAIYNSNWVEFDINDRRAIVLVLQRSHRPVTLKIGEMLDLNLETFASVINFTFSFATLMQRVV